MEGPDIPPFFICPISLQRMEDPVTVSTGVTYDRESISRWLSAYDRNTCPVTNQPLADRTLTPNTTLLRLIQSWAAENLPAHLSPASGPLKPPVDVLVVLELVGELRRPETRMKTMRRIRELVQENDDYRACMEEAGVTSLLSQLVKEPGMPPEVSSLVGDSASAIDEATGLLHLINPSPGNLKKISECRNGELINSLSTVVQRGSYQARIHAALLLRSVFKVVDDCYKVELETDLFDGLVEMLKDQNSNRPSTIAALAILMEVVPCGRNRAKAVQSGVVAVLLELLVEEAGDDKRKCELMLALLELLCARADGRLALMEHPAGVAAVSAKVLSVSQAATDRAVRVLLLVCRFCAGSGVVEEMMAVGAVVKLFAVVQVGGSRKTREKAKEIFGMHVKSWSKFPCFPSNCIP